MQKFNSAGVEIAFDVVGEGPPVLLIHGFASNHKVNWRDTGWIRVLAEAGHQVIALDNRGHGESQKLYDPQQYSAPTMADDAARLLTHLGIDQACVMGYSMGARITAFMLINHGHRVTRAVLAGLAASMISGLPGSSAIADALEAEDESSIVDQQGLAFRMFAQRTKSDLKALAACIRSTRVQIKSEALAHVTAPVLVVAGDRDTLAGDVQPLVAAIPGAKGVVLPGKDHMTAVGDLTYKREVVGFFAAD
jgi:pimeloyl-ACP methyl ester carboxylesterase